MTPQQIKLVFSVALVLAAMTAGWTVRHRRLLPESAARSIMTVVAVFGYPSVGFLSIWATQLRATDVWLPALGATHMIAMTVLGLLVGRLFASASPERGLFGLACGVGNLGSTMGGFVVYILYGEQGLGLAGILTLMFVPMVVLWTYPIARHFSPDVSRLPLAKLYATSLINWRSMGLLIVGSGVVLSSTGVPRPEWITSLHIVDLAVFSLIAAAYFAIGLRLHMRDWRHLKRLIAGLSVMRFAGGLAVAAGLVGITHLTAWPIEWQSLRGKVFLIEGFVPTAVSVVAVANMFHLQPRKASALFVANTVLYLLLVLPWIVLL